MTCVVALYDKSRNVWCFGGDTRQSMGRGLILQVPSKLFKYGPLVFGVSGSATVFSTLKAMPWSTIVPSISEDVDLAQVLQQQYIPAFLEKVRQLGFAPAKEDATPLKGEILIGYREKLCLIAPSGYASNVVARCSWAIGSGTETALGALALYEELFIQERIKPRKSLQPNDVIRMVLEVVARHNSEVAPPFTFMDTSE